MTHPADSLDPVHLWFGFDGRSQRIPAFVGLIGANLMSRVAYYPAAIAVSPLVGLLCSAPFIGMSLAVYRKRYRDAGLPGWCFALPVLMVASSFVRSLLVVSFTGYVRSVQAWAPLVALLTLVVVLPLFLPSRPPPPEEG
jgi:uncharacterized membrane protein YhaH (DUF805 family)